VGAQHLLLLCNTHAHGDHVFGNQVFADWPIIAHTGVRENLATRGEETLAGWRRNPRMAALVADVTLTPPTVVFLETLTLFFDGLEIQVRHLGAAHSGSDSVVWVPQARALFTGDLLFSAIVPAMPPGCNLAAWLQALDTLINLEPAHVIAGHGPMQSPAALADLRDWFLTLRTQVGKARAQGLDRETAIARVSASMQEASLRGMAERLPPAVGQVFDQLEWV
jgi:cyclase